MKRFATPKLLLVEDDIELRATIEDVLQRSGIRVSTAGDGHTALEMLRQEPFDAVLLDLCLPRVDGWEFRVRQKSDSSISHVPVVVMTADGTSKAHAIDAAAVLSKPVDRSVLVRKLNDVVESARRSRRAKEEGLASERLVSLGRMAGAFAHQINDSLTCVTSNLEFLRDRCSDADGDADVKEAVDDASEGARRIRSLASDFTRYSRSDVWPPRPSDVSDAVRTAIRMAEAAHRTLAVRFVGASTANAIAVPAVVTQTVLRLLCSSAENAVRDRFAVACDVRTERGEVAISLQVGGGSGHASDVDAVRRLVEEIGGTFTVRVSDFTRGTTYCMSFPAAQAPSA